MAEYKNYPLHEVARGAQKKIEQGFTVYQKFTCSSCGQRLTMDTPNVFHPKGDCDKCGAVTNIQLHGCNYLAVFSS